MAECDELGREAFLAKYGFRKARTYFLVEDDRLYDSKAIVGAAHGLVGSAARPLGADEFSGGEKTVAAHLESLGFSVKQTPPSGDDLVAAVSGRRNPKWADPELILALDLYLREGLIGSGHAHVIELSELLNHLQIHAERPDSDRFRNANGVALKLANFAALDPAHEGRGMSRGGKREADIWEMYAGDAAALAESVARIRAGNAASASQGSEDRAPTIATVPIEALNVRQFKTEHSARTAAAERREQQLVVEFCDHLVGRGHAVVRHCFNVDGRSLYCDLFDETDRCLYEAKGDVTRESLRMAVGQLFDYARHYDSRPSLAVLLPRTPSEDMLRYLASVNVAVVFRDPEGAWGRADQPASGRVGNGS